MKINLAKHFNKTQSSSGKAFCCLLTLVLLHCPKLCWSQSKVQADSTKAFAISPSLAIKRKQIDLQQKDSLLDLIYQKEFLRDSVDTQKSEAFYHTLKYKADNNRLTSRLHGWLIRNYSYSTTESPVILEDAPVHECHEGKIIRHVNIVRLKPFDGNVRNPNRKASTAVGKLGNKLHTRTREHVIKKNLLFDSFEYLNSQKLEDNERLLRSLPFIEDAVIKVCEVDEATVDIEVIVKDQWSIGGSVSPRSTDRFNASLYDQNFMGLGQTAMAGVRVNGTSEDKPFGWTMGYKVNNIAGKFVNAQFLHRDDFEMKATTVAVEKPFVTPEDKFAGGVQVGSVLLRNERIQEDSTFQDDSYNFADLWFGQTLSLKRKPDGSRVRTELATRVYYQKYLLRPSDVDINSWYKYHNYNLYLTEVSRSSRNYVKSNLIFGYGRTEDIPVGYRLSVSGGLESSEFGERFYMGGAAKGGKFIGSLGYLRGAVETGTFIRNQKPEQTTITTELNYFTHLFNLGNTSGRFFLNTSYVLGLNMFENDGLQVDRGHGISGLSGNEMRGQKRLLINAETVLFAPWYSYGFRFAFFTFGDFAFLADKSNDNLLKSDKFSTFGGGIRVRNEHLVFNTFELKAGYLTKTFNNSPHFMIEVGTHFSLNLEDFDTKKPKALPFE
ncbi:hypothetical protein V6R21_14015 [Limibacter armeniacum]|uniref:hypothetical protein n=1 Tax=Limibacter armeniacum TaxID=466084 RepID=UPI002FE5D779